MQEYYPAPDLLCDNLADMNFILITRFGHKDSQLIFGFYRTYQVITNQLPYKKSQVRSRVVKGSCWFDKYVIQPWSQGGNTKTTKCIISCD